MKPLKVVWRRSTSPQVTVWVHSTTPDGYNGPLRVPARLTCHHPDLLTHLLSCSYHHPPRPHLCPTTPTTRETTGAPLTTHPVSTMSHDSQPNTPKLRSASSPNIYSVTSTSTTTYSESASTQDKSRFDTSYIFPRDPSQIFYTPQSQSPRPASRGRASPAPGGRSRGYPTPTELNPIKILSGEAVPFFMSREYHEDEGRGREGSRLASLYADDESVAGASASGSRRQSETQSLFERGTRSSLGDGGIFSGGGAVRGNYDVEVSFIHSRGIVDSRLGIPSSVSLISQNRLATSRTTLACSLISFKLWRRV